MLDGWIKGADGTYVICPDDIVVFFSGNQVLTEKIYRLICMAVRKDL